MGLFAVEHTCNFDAFSALAKEDPVVLSAEADEGRNDAPELLGAAFTREQVAAERLENLNRDRLLDAADVSFRLVGPDDAFGARGSSFPNRPWQAELRENFLMQDRLVVLAPLVCLRDGFRFGGAEDVTVLRRNHSFEQMHHGGELAGA